MFNKSKNFSNLSSLSIFIFLNSFSVALKILLRVLYFFKRVFVATGPIPGNPSRMNCFCSSGVLKVLVCLMGFCNFGFSYRLATRIRKFAVSSSFFV